MAERVESGSDPRLASLAGTGPIREAPTPRTLCARKRPCCGTGWVDHDGNEILGYKIPDGKGYYVYDTEPPADCCQLPLCDYCGEPLAKADEFWVAAGASPQGELWHEACWQKEIRS